METKCNLIIDSCCDLPHEVVEREGVYLLKFPFFNESGEHLDDLYRSTTAHDFYEGMRNGDQPHTAQIPMPSLRAAFEWAHEQGKPAVYLGFSSGLSGTYQSIVTLKDMLQSRYPERTIECVDTLAASLGQGMLVYYAAKMKQQGASLEEVADWVRDNRLNMAHWFTVDDLMFLYRGGRVSRTAAFAGSLLNIKPVLHVDDEGHLIPMEKTRGRKKSIQGILKHMEASANQPVADQVVAISHGDCIEDVEYLQKLVTERFGVTKYIVNYIDPVIGSHSGPGTLALFFLASER